MLAMEVTLPLVLDLLILISGQIGADPRSGIERELPISFPISLEPGECSGENG